MVGIPVLKGMGANDDGGTLVIAARMRALTAVKGGEPGKGCMTKDARQTWDRVEIVQSTEYRVLGVAKKAEVRVSGCASRESCALSPNGKKLPSFSALQL
jgi:hypothetical protein